MNRLLAILLPALVLAASCGCASRPLALTSAMTLRDADGKSVRPLAVQEDRAVAFVFLANECPISNRAVPELLRLQAAYKAKGVEFWFVNPNIDETDDAVRDHAREYGLTSTPLRDPGLRLANAVGAKVTPTAVVVSPRGEVLYRGRIDDRYAALGQGRPEPTRHDLELALEAVVAGRSPEPMETAAVGCRFVESL